MLFMFPFGPMAPLHFRATIGGREEKGSFSN